MDILRFLTAGSVDDGKSTLIGRLLYDSQSILTDQMEDIKRRSVNKTDAIIDLALLTDGLRAEREQGITIDVAYKYFSTPKRKFIIADAPGHIQYTRNMVTGASNSDLTIILIDARNGVVEQTRRHAIIASLLKIPHIVVAINKMDKVEYLQDVYNDIVNDFAKVAMSLKLSEVIYIPISALDGDNIVSLSPNLPWYGGKPLLTILEDIPVRDDINLVNARFPVQYVIKPESKTLPDFRGYAGKIISGIYHKGDKVVVQPSGRESKIKSISFNGRELEEVRAPRSAILQLEDDLDVSRGDLIVRKDDSLKTGNRIDALLFWMDEKPMIPGNKYFLQLNSRRVRSTIREINYKLDVNTLEEQPNHRIAELNDVLRVKLKTAEPISYDAYDKIRPNGCAILIDETGNTTSGACILL